MDAFRSKKDLEMMLDYELDWKLNQMAGGDNYTQIVYRLVDKAEAQGQLIQLLEAAIAANLGNPKLINLKKSYLNPITQNEINNLKLTLEKIDFSIVKSSFLRILPEGSIEDNVKLKTVENIDDHVISSHKPEIIQVLKEATELLISGV